MISVLTLSVRPEGLALVEKALKRQTFKDFEHIIQGRAIPLADPNVWTLNYDYNEAIKKSKGDLIVSWQDWTYADPTALEKFWFHYQQEPKTLVTAVGNKYADDTWTVKTWQDPRERSDQGTFYPCYFNDIEFNLCSIPRSALFDIGGFDESLDRYFGMDGYSVVDRINLFGGYDFKIDQTIKSYSLEHGRPENWEEKNALYIYNEKIRPAYLANPVLPYLQSDHGKDK